MKREKKETDEQHKIYTQKVTNTHCMKKKKIKWNVDDKIDFGSEIYRV